MSKEAIKRFVIGAIWGVFFVYGITLLQSGMNGKGAYIPVTPALQRFFGTQLAAVVFQAFMSALIGGIYGATSVIWEIENWSLAKQTALHFCITMPLLTVVSIMCKWIPLTLLGISLWLLFSLTVYGTIWLVCYLTWKHKVKEINEKLK